MYPQTLQDDGRCPGAFHVGCQDDVTAEPTQEPTTTLPESRCTFANNTLGSCTCDEQLFISGDCQKVNFTKKVPKNIQIFKGFYCMDDAAFHNPEDAAIFTAQPQPQHNSTSTRVGVDKVISWTTHHTTPPHHTTPKLLRHLQTTQEADFLHATLF